MTVANSAQIDLTEIKDPVTARYLADLANPIPEPPVFDPPIEREQAFVFRTHARTTDNPIIRIPGITRAQEDHEKDAARWQRVYDRKHGDKAAYYADLQDRVGGKHIKFRRIAQSKGAVYQTSDPVIAEFIRGVIAQGSIPGLYEDYAQSAPLRSRYTDQMFPNTEQGRNDLARYDLAIEKAADAQAGPKKAPPATKRAAKPQGA